MRGAVRPRERELARAKVLTRAEVVAPLEGAIGGATLKGALQRVATAGVGAGLPLGRHHALSVTHENAIIPADERAVIRSLRIAAGAVRHGPQPSGRQPSGPGSHARRTSAPASIAEPPGPHPQRTQRHITINERFITAPRRDTRKNFGLTRLLLPSCETMEIPQEGKTMN